MMKHILFAWLFLFVSTPALARPPAHASPERLERDEFVLTGKAADLEVARKALTSRGFAIREVARTDDEVTIALRPAQGNRDAISALLEDMMCGRLGSLRFENVGFVGNEMDPNAMQRPTKYILYGNQRTVRRIAEEAGQRGWTVAPAVPAGDDRWFTTLASGPSMTQGQFVAFLDTLFAWKVTDAALAPVQEGKLFPSYE